MSAKSLKDLPVEVGVVYEGERVRGPDMHIELGGPKAEYKFELVHVHDKGDELEDGKVTVIGKDIKDFEEGSHIPFGVLIEVYGKEIEKDLEGILERRVHDFINYIHGMMHLNQRSDIWCRISKSARDAGLKFEDIGAAMILLYKQEYNFIEKIQITIITDEDEVKKYKGKALTSYNARDDRVRGMKDEEVDVFYGCSLCQSFAPNHICVVSPQRISLCGALTWLDCRASAKIDPDGPNFPIEKGECLDEMKGEFTGVNEVVEEYSHGANEKICMYSMLDAPHTSCGCFEAIAFYMPEVDGIGMVDRNFKGESVNGMKFSTMAGQTGGGEQTVGFLGFGVMWMESDKFFKADGGWNRIVWMPSYLKEKAKSFIPEEIYDKIPTEAEIKSIGDLKNYLQEKQHPVVANWAPEEEEEIEEEAPGIEMVGAPGSGDVPVMTSPTMTIPGSGGIKIILKNAKIYADRMIIKKSD
ncbi:MAG: CO dehydrogenase/CO-methylating acetyl-CoA synthase complex subunit beta [Candidatus Altiarchaeales archaeon HGW-Altiarchaeales-3]|nr:MAG: CO dehydrogenase/CO-methylating acetyl-CoA synthase complex subunit beta [Candidatus Altiarchaeales archaeon HGW-Altiarchaeales-3]